MDLATPPKALTCAECGEQIEDAGYLPATDRDGGYDPLPDAAICDACGYNDVGMIGCVPDLDEVIEPGPDDALLYVRRTDDGFEVLSAKE